MAIPQTIQVKDNTLPDNPGVYFYYDKSGELLYVGKATSLKKRVGSYFTKAHGNRIGEMVGRIAKIDYIETKTTIEALVLEANQIKAKKPYYNVLLRDDKTFLYLVITKEDFPKPILMRGQQLEEMGINPFDKKLSEIAKKQFLSVYGPYTSGPSLRKALDYIRRFIPWSTCEPPEAGKKKRPCFDRQIKRCPGVCTGEISKAEYRKIIKRLRWFFDGKQDRLAQQLDKDMRSAAKKNNFELAAQLRNQLFSLEHIQDVALITKEDVELPIDQVKPLSSIDLDGRIEAYDISNISGTSAVGSMVVFEHGKAAKSEYRKFKIKTVEGANDTAMMEEVMRRRLRRAELYPKAWPLPQVMVIDGGKPQVNRVQQILDELGVAVPILGLAKGPDRKQDRLVYDRTNVDLVRVAQRGKPIFQQARDEAHRFAVSYHKNVRAKASGINRGRN